jgi:hypothetical protein
MSELQIADTIVLPPEAATGRYVLFAKSGYGKTNADAVLTEAFIAGAGVPTIVLDPLGNMWGLRSSSDGESAGLPIAIFGGEHGDVPLPADRAEYIADMLAEGVSAVLDLREVANVEEFAAVFLPRLLRRSQTNMHVIFEEGDRFARNTGKVTPVTQFCRASRNAGIGWTFSTQKPQVLHREVTDTANVFVAMRMTGELAQEAMGGEIGSRIGKRTAAKMIGDLPTLQRGEAWFIPDADWLGVDVPEWEPLRMRFRLRNTFEVRPPKVGEVRRQPKVLADVDLARLREALASDSADAVAPAAAGDALAAMERRAETAEANEQYAEACLRAIRTKVQALLDDPAFGELDIEDGIVSDEPAQDVSHENELLRRSAEPEVRGASPVGIAAGSVPARPRSHQSGDLGPERKLLIAVAASHTGTLTPQQLGTISGFVAGGSTYREYVRRLKVAGYVDVSKQGVTITNAGFKAAGPVPRIATTADTLALWRAKLGPEREFLDVAIAAYPKATDRATIARVTGKVEGGSTFREYLRRIKVLGLVTVSGDAVRASDTLFPTGAPR